LEPTSEKAGEGLSIALLKRGDTAEFARLVSQFQDMVFACGRSVGLRDQELEDAASETFMAAYRYIKTYDGKGKLSSWLWKIAYHKAVDHLGARPRAELFAEGQEESVAADCPLPGARLEAEERSRILWEAVGKLPLSQAATVVLFYREGKSTRDIAEILEKPENTIRIWLHRGRNELHGRLRSIQETDYVRQ
jgi:RNA polymerase sigma factor (sigma-70 family)